MKRIIPIALFFLSACAEGQASPPATGSLDIPSVTSTPGIASTNTPVPTSAETFTSSPMPTNTQLPTNTSKATPEWPEFPPLNPDGPYIAFWNPERGNVLLNPDGSGMAIIDFPVEFYSDAENLDPGGRREVRNMPFQNVSPDGEWALVYHGMPGGDYVEQDLSLSLVHLPDGLKYFIAVILPEDERYERYGSYECGNYYYSGHFFQAVWSPDGRYLAFAAYSPEGDSLELFVLELPDRILHKLTNDHAEIEDIRWSPSGDRIFFTNGHDFDIQWARSGSFTLNVTRPDNQTNQGIQTLAYSKDRIMVAGFDGNQGIIYAAHENAGCLQGGVAVIHGINYLKVSTQETISIYSRTIFTESLVIDHINRAVFLVEVLSPDDDISHARIVSYEGKIISTVDTSLYPLCGQAILLSGPKFAYLCTPSIAIGGEPPSILGITFGGKTEAIADWGIVSVSPDRKWFTIEGKDLFLFSREAKPVTSFTGTISSKLWAPDGKGLYLVPDGKQILYYSFAGGKTSIIFSCPVDGYCKSIGLMWIP